MTLADAPTVFVIDDDASVRAAIQGMLKSVGLHSETFAIAARVLAQQASGRAELPCSGRETSGSQRPGLSARIGRRGRPDSYHLHHRSWRYSR